MDKKVGFSGPRAATFSFQLTSSQQVRNTCLRAGGWGRGLTELPEKKKGCSWSECRDANDMAPNVHCGKDHFRQVKSGSGCYRIPPLSPPLTPIRKEHRWGNAQGRTRGSREAI